MSKWLSLDFVEKYDGSASLQILLQSCVLMNYSKHCAKGKCQRCLHQFETLGTHYFLQAHNCAVTNEFTEEYRICIPLFLDN